MVGQGIQGFRGPAHGQMSCFQNVEPVDFLPFRRGNSPDHRRIGGELMIEALTFSGADFFRIVQSRTGKVIRENHRGGGDRPRKWPPARLVNAGDPKKTTGTEGGFEG